MEKLVIDLAEVLQSDDPWVLHKFLEDWKDEKFELPVGILLATIRAKQRQETEKRD